MEKKSKVDMEDSAMTIEYLRARLLSERSVSRSAKQRADELADRVAGLEEQLKVVCLQRKKTEKATSDVLFILRNLGISDDSDGYDLSSDQDLAHSQACNGNCSSKSADRSRSMDQQGHEPLAFSCRSLSWKSCRCLSHCERKFISAPSRRRSSFPSTDISSPKYRFGKSCRKIKHKEMSSTADELSKNESILDFQIADDDSKISRCNHENQDEKLSAGQTESTCITSPRKMIDSGHHCEKHEGDKKMERVLESQAELIYRFEAEENAQIKWEENYKENNSSMPESVEPGNQSDVTEERDELKRQPACFQPVNEEAKYGSKISTASVVCRILSNKNDVQPSFQVTDGPKNYHNMDLEVYSRAPHPAIAVPMNETKQIHDKPECSLPSTRRAAIKANYFKGDISKPTLRESINVSNEPSKELGSVLEALQQAKLSLQHKLRTSVLPEDRFIHDPAMGLPDRAKVPASCAALFRVPTDLQAEENVYKSYSNSRSCSSLMVHHHESTSAVPVNDQTELKPHEGVTMSNVSEGSSFDFAPNWMTTLSSLGSGDEYARSPSVLSEKGFSNSSRFKCSPQTGAPGSTFVGSDGQAQSPYLDSHFSFLTSDLHRSSSQLDSGRSCIYGTDPHPQGSYVNRPSPSRSIETTTSRSIETTTSSLIGKDQFVRACIKNVY